MSSQKEKTRVIILLEDDNKIRKGFENAFEDLSLNNLKILFCADTDEFESRLNLAKKENNLRGLIIDLSNSIEEEVSRSYKASEYIINEFKLNRIPIFVHSAYLEYYEELDDKGTVFKVEKSANSIDTICTSIKKMEDSGFLDIFCLGGELERELMHNIHDAFTKQFKGKDIEEIIDSIIESSPENVINRTKEIFERIAIRSIFENRINATRIKLNSVEHYYRRTSDFDFWTGDVFKNIEDRSQKCIILTPRCNIDHNKFDELLLCKIIPINEKLSKEKLRRMIADDPKTVGPRYRFLPPTPQFKGGLVDFNTTFTLNTEVLKDTRELELTLSDELTNDVIRKFASYSLRGGIAETEKEEVYQYAQKSTLSDQNEG